MDRLVNCLIDENLKTTDWVGFFFHVGKMMLSLFWSSLTLTDIECLSMILYYISLLLRVIRPTTPLLDLITNYIIVLCFDPFNVA